MKKIFPLILSGLFVYSCSTPFILKNARFDNAGIYTFGKNENRNFYFDVAITEKLDFKWTASTNGSQPNTSVLILNNYVIASDLSGRIYAFDKDNGKLIGYEKYNGAISTAPVLNNLRIYFVLNEKHESYSTLKMFDFVNNKILAEDKIIGSVTNELLRLDEGIVVLTDVGELIKYNYVGYRDYSVNLKTSTNCNPAANDKFIALGTVKGELVILNRSDGTIYFKEKIAGAIESGFTFENSIIYFGDSNGVLYAFDSNNKKIIWQFNTGAKIVVTPVFDQSKIIVGNLSGKIVAVDKNNGEKIWTQRTKGIINTTPLLTKTFLVQPDFNRKVYLINSSIGSIVDTLEFDRRVKLTPVINDGILFLGYDRGKINAYQIFEVK
ncbi:MAG: PQQ-binding-like beta-propeller repeat protein [Bacteroidota bacterium]